MFVFGVLPLWRVSLVTLFRILWDSSPVVELVFDVLWRIRIPKKVKSFLWQVLLGRVNTMDRLVRKMPLLLGSFCCILYRKVGENLNPPSLEGLCGIASFRSLMLF